MAHYWVFVIGVLLVGVSGGFFMGSDFSPIRRARWALAAFVLGAVLILGYLISWVAGKV